MQQEESDSEDKLKEVTTSFWSETQEQMGNQAQRRSVLRIRRASSEETRQQQPSPPRQLSHSGQLSPSASRSPPDESEYDFIGPFGKMLSTIIHTIILRVTIRKTLTFTSLYQEKSKKFYAQN